MLHPSLLVQLILFNFGRSTMLTSLTSMATRPSCAVVGVGVLGTSLCRQLLENSNWDVTGVTKTTARHEEIRKDVGGSLRLTMSTGDQQFDNVVFCAPPSGFDDYPAAVKEAAESLWKGPESGGIFLFTSSGAVYGPGESNTVTEDSPIADPDSSPRIARLVLAEKAALQAGGCCLRLAGLYNLQRGPHNFWLTSGKPISGTPSGIINMLHYDDAASACLAALQVGPGVCQKRAFLISDGKPLSRREICESALQAAVYRDCQMPEFATKEESLLATGKIYDGSVSNQALKWTPKYESFDSFMKSMS